MHLQQPTTVASCQFQGIKPLVLSLTYPRYSFLSCTFLLVCSRSKPLLFKYLVNKSIHHFRGLPHWRTYHTLHPVYPFIVPKPPENTFAIPFIHPLLSTTELTNPCIRSSLCPSLESTRDLIEVSAFLQLPILYLHFDRKHEPYCIK